MTKVKTELLNKLSALILDFEIDVMRHETEVDERLEIDDLKLGREEYVARREYDDELYEKLEESRELVLNSLDKWNELADEYGVEECKRRVFEERARAEKKQKQGRIDVRYN